MRFDHDKKETFYLLANVPYGKEDVKSIVFVGMLQIIAKKEMIPVPLSCVASEEDKWEYSPDSEISRCTVCNKHCPKLGGFCSPVCMHAYISSYRIKKRE